MPVLLLDVCLTVQGLRLGIHVMEGQLIFAHLFVAMDEL